MKTYHWLSGLLVSFVFLLASCSSLPLNIKDRSLAAEQPKSAPLILAAVQTAPGKKPNLLARFLKKYKTKISALLALLWLWPLARFYRNEKRCRILGWQLEDHALVKIIKDNTARLWHHQHAKSIIRLEDCKQ